MGRRTIISPRILFRKSKPLNNEELRNFVPFAKTVKQTPEYKKHFAEGNSPERSLELAAKDVQVNTRGKWFSIDRLPARLKKRAMKVPVKFWK